MPRSIQILMLVVMLLVGGGVVAYVVLDDSGDETATRSEPGTQTMPVGRSDDGKDPRESGCASSGVTQAEAPVRDGRGRRVGRLELRHSTACQTAWGRYEAPNPDNAPVHVVATRPKTRTREAYRFLEDRPVMPVFGNMLSQRSGCVYAEAWLGDGRTRELYARTACRP